MEEIKTAVEGLQSAFEAFKSANDERIKQIETKGHADPLLVEKVNAANAEIDKLQGQVKALGAAQKRLPQNVGGQNTKAYTPEEEAHAKAFKSFLRRGVEAGLEEASIKAFQAAYPEAKSMSVGSDTDGGYLVPTDTSGRIVQRIYESSDIRSIANIETISTDKIEGPLDLDEAGAGWTGETGPRGNTNTPKLGKYSIPVHELYAQPALTQTLLDDAAYNVENWLGNKIADKIGRLEETAFVKGDGVAKPRGFASYPTANTVDKNRAWGTLQYLPTGAAGAFADANPANVLFDVIGNTKKALRKGATFLMPRLTVSEIRKLTDGQGRYIWQPGLQLGQPETLLNYPIAEAEDMDAIAANALGIAFGNFKEGYTIVDRIGIRVLRDPYTQKPFVLFYTTKRVGGDVVNFDAIKFVKFAAN